MGGYCGYKLLDTILLVCRDNNKTIDKVYEAMLVDPANEKQLKKARSWATYNDKGPYSNTKDKNNNWIPLWDVHYEPVEFTLDNKDFTLELVNPNTTTWGCRIKKDQLTFSIKIDLVLLSKLLKDSIFEKGVCKGSLAFITQQEKVGMVLVGSETYKQCLTDLRINQAKYVSEFSYGDILGLKTKTNKEYYLGTITQYYSFSIGDNNPVVPRSWNASKCTVTKLARPILLHIIDPGWKLYGEPIPSKVSEVTTLYKIVSYCSAIRSYMRIKNPGRLIIGKLELDISQEDFLNLIMSESNDLEDFINIYSDRLQCKSDDQLFCKYLASSLFGCNTKPFDLDSTIMNKVKEYGINYIDETK